MRQAGCICRNDHAIPTSCVPCYLDSWNSFRYTYRIHPYFPILSPSAQIEGGGGGANLSGGSGGSGGREESKAPSEWSSWLCTIHRTCSHYRLTSRRRWHGEQALTAADRACRNLMASSLRPFLTFSIALIASLSLFSAAAASQPANAASLRSRRLLSEEDAPYGYCMCVQREICMVCCGGACQLTRLGGLVG